MPADAKSSGFTLVEILVALAVAMAILLPLQRMFSLGVRASSLADSNAHALLLAESGLELYRARRTFLPGETTERVNDRFERRFTVQHWDNLPLSPDAGMRLYRIIVSVNWTDGPRQRDVTLSTLMIGSEE